MFRFVSLKLYNLPLWAWQIMPIIIAAVLTTSVAFGAELTQRSLMIDDDTPGAVTNYQLGFNLTNSETIGSIEIQFCSNSPLLVETCTPTTGNASAAVLESQTGISGFSISSATSNTLILGRTPSNALAGPVSFAFANITNPSTAGTFYARLQTFASSDASGSALDTGGLALVINSGYTISATVPPYLLFCVGVTISNYNCDQSSGDLINFGDLSTATTATAQSQMVVATNAQSGYTVQLSGDTLTSGNYTVPPLSSDTGSTPGQSQFGLNLVANTQPVVGENVQGPGTGAPASSYGLPDTFKFNSGDVIASSTQPSDLKEYTISYIINIAKSQPAGVYATTLTFVGIGNF